ncbi:Ubiquitin-protein ligase E3C [Cichlidogyrus casuarinus]|uniref:HECT-type E3 ubiquitin transferase n=1 Tax=Cichlidogyrus casuarinus TaxID=1844966 RepID=A0ABD2PVE3_9PLAT
MACLLSLWTKSFREAQRLVQHIYAWDRRRQMTNIERELCTVSAAVNRFEEAQETLPSESSHDIFPQDSNSAPTRTSNSQFDEFADGNLTQKIENSEWLRSTMFDLTNNYSTMLVNQPLAVVARTPFGTHSRLNPEREPDAETNISNVILRQMLVLNEMPFVIPFSRRVRVFRALFMAERELREDPFDPAPVTDRVNVTVRRDHLYEDSFERLSRYRVPSLKPYLHVSFINQLGIKEMGVDGGGLTKEFLSDLMRSALEPTRGFFLYTQEDKTLYPNPMAKYLSEDYLEHYFFHGRVLAKAIKIGMHVEVRFAHFFLAKLLSKTGGNIEFEYLRCMDPQLYHNLSSLKTFEGDVSDLSLDFTVTDSILGSTYVTELKPGGASIPVTESNKMEYIHLVAHYRLNQQFEPTVRAFLAGLNNVISIEWLRIFDPIELQMLISGADTKIDTEDMRKHTLYQASTQAYGSVHLSDFVSGTKAESETVQAFWRVLNNFSENEKRALLRFVTGCSRPPMFGFRHLVPAFSLQLDPDPERLPTSSTCSNLLTIPDGVDEETLRQKLVYVISSAAGFEYS